MEYKITVKNGERIERVIIFDVDKVELEGGTYSFYNKFKELLFSIPADSVLYIFKMNQ